MKIDYQITNEAYTKEELMLNNVTAKYSRAAVPSDWGNICIEALPRVSFEMKDVIGKYTKSLPIYTPDEAQNDPALRLGLVNQLKRDFRVTLPFSRELEIEFNTALIESYRNREFYITTSKKDTMRLYGDVADSAVTGFALIGMSGCGKSSALKNLLSQYPQVITHNVNTNGIISFTQIVYIAVCCPTNSNLSVLFVEIGKAIDRALGLDNVYEAYVRKQRTLGAKMDVICNLIETFGIGAIILDEIQLLDFSANKESSFESFLTITNRTKVALCVVGTEDAYKKIFSSHRTARRLGKIIDASLYCKSKKFFMHFFKALTRYQWLDEHIDFDSETVEAFWQNTHGLAYMVINLYIGLHKEYLSSFNPPEINAAFVHKVASKVFPDKIRKIIHAMFVVDKNDSLSKALTKLADKDVNSKILDECNEQKAVLQSIVLDEDANEREALILRIISHIHEKSAEIPEDRIREACESIIKDSSVSEVDQLSLLIDVYSAVTTSRKKTVQKKKNKNTNTLSTEEMFSQLESHIL